MKKYEIMFIVRPTLGEDELKQTVKKFADIITSNEAKLVEQKDLGQKELAYDIKDFKSGYYFLFEVESENDKAVKEFDRVALINSDIVRHLITSLED